MSDLRVDTVAIEEAYLKRAGGLSSGTKAREAKLQTLDAADKNVRRIVDGVIRLFEARTMAEHRDAVEIFEHDLLWDGPPIRLSNKGHLRLATYLFKYLARVTILPAALAVSSPSPGRTLIELDAIAVSHPHRTWALPASLLLPAEVAKAVSFKVELFTGRLTNLPAFAPKPVRSLNGIAMGALPHAFEGALGFVFDYCDGGSFYAAKRNAAFKARHPDSANPTWDWVQDLARDIPAWAQEQAVIGAETAQALFGKSFAGVAQTVQKLVNFYVWLLTRAWAAVSRAANAAADLLGGGGGEAGTTAYARPSGAAAAAAAPAGGGAKVYKGTLPQAQAPPLITARPIAAGGSA
ncbi:hypothetical protein HT031_001650 [Scenedesmus sp. PABB004]|nr:hypothetical protein HT031_001650 [Scenedesmus sp. PABB004]